MEVDVELQRSSAARSWLHRKPALAALLLLLLVAAFGPARNAAASQSPKHNVPSPCEEHRATNIRGDGVTRKVDRRPAV